MKLNKRAGFTLIELMIVILIIAVIMAYAVPSYLDYVLRAKRSEAHNALLQIASLQERNYANLNQYGSSADLSLSTLYPAPTAANKLNYTISMTNSATTYTISAVAFGGQVKDSDCITFILDHLGAKSPVTGDCW